jgi:hypothetical protein
MVLKRILKALENIETNTRRMLLLIESDVDTVVDGEGGPGEELGEALKRLDGTPNIVLGDEDLGNEERRRVI